MAMASAKSVYNFCSGPAMLPQAVMAKAQQQFQNHHGLGISAMEMSHRSDEFLTILAAAESNLRQLMAIPENYRILFLQGGASLQFSAIPLNLANTHRRVGFLNSGYWAKKAMAEAAKYADVVELGRYSVEPAKAQDATTIDYLHLTPNETIDGIEFDQLPAVNVPIVADMSSCILSRHIHVADYGLIYAGAQKNIGPAGLAVVIVREDLIGHAAEHTPRLLNYAVQVAESSMANTPPTYAIYLANLVFEWLLNQGGVSAMETQNKHKAQQLYRAIDESALVFNSVPAPLRSRMNVPFFFHQPALTEIFITQAQQHGLLNLTGHRSSGGCRASIYNAMPLAGVEQLINFLKEFEKRHV